MPHIGWCHPIYYTSQLVPEGIYDIGQHIGTHCQSRIQFFTQIIAASFILITRLFQFCLCRITVYCRLFIQPHWFR